jgi:hypothetical protein
VATKKSQQDERAPQSLVLFFFKERLVRPVWLALAAVLIVLSLLLNVQLVMRLVKPGELQLDIKDVTIVQQNVQVKFQNVGKQSLTWVEIGVWFVRPENMTVEASSRTVMANPTPAGAERSFVAAIRETPRVLALCVRSLDRQYVMSKSEWYFMMGPNGKYSEPPEDSRATIQRLRPCQQNQVREN